jgi:hypothetical protein
MIAIDPGDRALGARIRSEGPRGWYLRMPAPRLDGPGIRTFRTSRRSVPGIDLGTYGARHRRDQVAIPCLPRPPPWLGWAARVAYKSRDPDYLACTCWGPEATPMRSSALLPALHSHEDTSTELGRVLVHVRQGGLPGDVAQTSLFGRSVGITWQGGRPSMDERCSKHGRTLFRAWTTDMPALVQRRSGRRTVGFHVRKRDLPICDQ